MHVARLLCCVTDCLMPFLLSASSSSVRPSSSRGDFAQGRNEDRSPGEKEEKDPMPPPPAPGDPQMPRGARCRGGRCRGGRCVSVRWVSLPWNPAPCPPVFCQRSLLGWVPPRACWAILHDENGPSFAPFSLLSQVGHPTLLRCKAEKYSSIPGRAGAENRTD